MERQLVQKAVEAVARWFVALAESEAQRVPPEGQAGAQALVEALRAQAATLPPDLVGSAIAAIGEAIRSGDFGPAGTSDADVV